MGTGSRIPSRCPDWRMKVPYIKWYSVCRKPCAPTCRFWVISGLLSISNAMQTPWEHFRLHCSGDNDKKSSMTSTDRFPPWISWSWLRPPMWNSQTQRNRYAQEFEGPTYRHYCNYSHPPLGKKNCHRENKKDLLPSIFILVTSSSSPNTIVMPRENRVTWKSTYVLRNF